MTLVLPLGRRQVKENSNHMEMSDLAVNEKGILIDTAEKAGNHPIKIKH